MQIYGHFEAFPEKVWVGNIMITGWRNFLKKDVSNCL